MINSRQIDPIPTKSPNGRLIRNSLFNSSSWAINFGVQLLMIPFLLHRLGLNGFGIYSLLVNIIGYSVLADLGLGQGVIKFVAEMRARGDNQSLSHSVNAALWVQTLLGSIGMLLIFIFSRRLALLLKIPILFLPDAVFCLRLCAVAFFFTMISGTFISVLMGMQRYDLTSRINITTNLIMNAAILTALLLGGGFKIAVGITAFFAIVNCLLFFVLVKKNIPDITIFSSFSYGHFKDLFNFSGFMFISRISSFFCNYILVFMISFFLGPAVVPLYAVPLRMINGAMGFLTTAAAVIFPFASEVSVEKDQERMRRILIQSSRLVAAISIPVNLAIAAFAKPILTVWMGLAFAEKAAPVLSLLGLMSMLGSLSTIPNLITMGLGHARVIGLFSLLSLVFFSLFVPLGILAFGVYGAGWAVLFSLLPGLTLVAYEVKKIFMLPLWYYAKEVFNFHFFPILLMIAYLVFFGAWLPVKGVLLLALPILFLISYFFLLVACGRLPLDKIMAYLRMAR